MNNQLIPRCSPKTKCELCSTLKALKHQPFVVSSVQLGSAYCILVHLCEIKITTQYALFCMSSIEICAK